MAVSLSVSPAEGQTPTGADADTSKNYPKLESALARLVIAGKARAKAALPLAPKAGVDVPVQEGIRVIVEAEPGAVADSLATAESLGATVETTYKNLVQVRMPEAALEALSLAPSVKFVRLPMKPVSYVTSQGVSLIGADTWQTAGLTGSGVKVAILDVEFGGLQAAIDAGEVPAPAGTWWSPSYGQGSGVHGTACAEIVYDIAPGAQLYLASVNSEVELGNAVAWLIAQDVDIISHSVGWFLSAGNGTGDVNEIVEDARAAGILWINAAGNDAQKHWSGTWTDTDSDGYLNFPGTGANYIPLSGTIDAYLRWDDPWTASSNDYDLYLYSSISTSFDTQTPVDGSDGPQDGNDEPSEGFSFTGQGGATYYLAIKKWLNPNPNVNFDLFTPNATLPSQHRVASYSLATPADSPNALAVGAVNWNNPGVIEYYSSQGPTRDGRPKPDVVAPARVTTLSYGVNNGVSGGFWGTSASTPHVAGAAALVKQAYPAYTAAQLQSFMEGRAVDLGAAGKDSVFGSGRLQLGSSPVPAADFHASATSVQAGTAVNFTDDSTNTPTSWAWDFDTSTPSTDSTAQNPSHTYTVAGTYSVKLTASNSAGSSPPTIKNNYITVTPGALHHIAVSPANPSVEAGGSQAYTAAGYDQYDNAISGLTFTWSISTATAGAINASTGVLMAGATPGAYNNVVQATSGGVIGSASVTVTAGALHHITVSPSNPSVAAGGNQAYTATGYNQYNAAIGGLTFAWSVTNATAGSINASTGAFTAGTTPGSYSNVIQATSGAVTGYASVTVTPTALHHITVSPSSATLFTGGNQTYTFVAYDQYDNVRAGDVIAWSVTNAVAGGINASTGAFTAGTTPGAYNDVIRATSGAINGTASVTVRLPLHHITVSPASPTLPAGGVQTYTAAGYDQNNGVISDATFTWSVANPAAGAIDPSTGVFTAGGTMGSYNDAIVATSGAITGRASVTVVLGPLHHITVSPSNPSVAMNGSVTFSAQGYDAFNNPVSGLTFSWSMTNPANPGSINAATGEFTAGTLAGAFSGIQASAGGVSGATSVTVTAGAVHHIRVVPSHPDVVRNTSRAFSAIGYDQYDNVINGLTFAWSRTNASAGVIDPATGVFTATNTQANLGDYIDVVHASSGGVTGMASVNVVDATASGTVINGTVTLQGSQRPAAGRVVGLIVKLFNPGASDADLRSGNGALWTDTPLTEDTGSNNVIFQMKGVPQGTYDITVVGGRTLMNVKKNVVVAQGGASVNFGTLLEGDCNNSDNARTVNALDFSSLASSYLKAAGQPGFNANADFDRNGLVNALDLSLLATNYLSASPLVVP